MTGNAGVRLGYSSEEWLAPSQRQREGERKERWSQGKRKEGSKNEKERGERQENTKKKGYQMVSASLLSSFLPKLLGRFLETAEPIPWKPTGCLDQAYRRLFNYRHRDVLFPFHLGPLWGSALALTIIFWKVIRTTSPFSLCIQTEASKHFSLA